MRPGEAVYTVEQIKSRFGVSQATVTRALERLRREGIIHRPTGRARLFISEVPPRALHRVAVIRPTWPSPDYDAMVRHLIEIGQARGWGFEIIAAASSLGEVDLERAIGGNDGAILLFSASQLPEHIASALRKPRKPVVLMRELPLELPVTGVSLDDVEVGRLAVEHLAALGHKRILAVVSEPMMRSVHERVIGWRQGMRAIGMEYCDELLLDCGVPAGQDSIRHTYEVVRRWLTGQHPDFSAIFCVHWTGALAVSRALREHTGLQVPRDLSVIAFAGESLLLPYLNPPLTSVEFDMAKYAEAALDLLQRHFDDPDAEPKQTRITPYVVERGSTRALDT
jgi:LacI family transcriptional regulator, repressor for deo operon, udp, cdd, tsx, nupC, and nupG